MNIEIYLKASPGIVTFKKIRSLHEEGVYTVIYLNNEVSFRYPTADVFRIRVDPYATK